MSAPTTHDPLVVDTKDGTVWQRRAVTSDGRGLYAVTGSCSCPEYLMATLAELAEHGIAGSAFALPMPVGVAPQPRDEQERLALQVFGLQDDVARLQREAAAAQVERDRMRERVSEPYGCAHCGIPKRSHGRQWLTGVGVHSWVAPDQGQIAERMKARRTVRLAARAAELGRLRARVEELLVERHSTNESLDTAGQELQRRRDRIAELEAAPTFVYRAEHPDSEIVLGTYSNRDAAVAHCEALARREGSTGLVSWVPDDGDALSPEELTFFDVEYCDGDDVPVQTCTGYVVTPLEVAASYDEEADE